MPVEDYAHGNRINLAGFSVMARFMRETSAQHLPPITRFVLGSSIVDMHETVRALKTGDTRLHHSEAFPNEGDRYAPVFGLAVTVNHLFPDYQADDDAIKDKRESLLQHIKDSDINAYPFNHAINMETPMQYAIFIPYTMVKENEGQTIIEGNPKQIDDLLDVLLEQKILDPQNPQHSAMIEDCFSLRTRTNSPYLEP